MPLMSTWNYHSIVHRLCVHAKSLQWCPSLCDLMGHSLPASSVHGILQATKRSGLLCPPPGGLPHPGIDPTSLYLLILFLFFIFILLYNTVLVLPYIDVNLPWVYMSSQSWIPLPPRTPYGWYQLVFGCVCVLSRFRSVQVFATLDCSPQSMGFSRWEYWSALPCPPPGALPNPGMISYSFCIGSQILYY